MSVEENLRKGEAVVEAYNAKDLDGLAKSAAESYLGYAPDQLEPRKGREGLREWFQGVFTAFPDGRWEVVRSFGQGDLTCAEITATGTHTGPLPGPGGEMIPATNKSVRADFVLVTKWEGGEATETRAYYDQLGYLAQLGLTP
ncbi:MAG: ester cyclase [Thermoplasmata archaeon]